VALEWNLAADPEQRGQYPFEIDHSTGIPTLDPRPMVRALVADLRAVKGPAMISAAFHDTLAAGTAALVEEAAARQGHLPVVLTGGCFQNARLAETLLARLSPRFEVYLHGEVPPGDGGLALGQALIADAVTR